ncbi:monofunctional biosynthetic peptidoglycan transglycosylase [Polaromonas sp.]|nr:monofunctional biosynthetic peptidoglycan transglycosylase [Polaromonas sp.]
MKALLRLLLLLLLAGLALQLYFVGRIALMAYVNPESSAFQRSEAYLIVANTGALRWRQQWVPYAQISANLKRAVIASEDASFSLHDGVDMAALEKAWEKNTLAAQRAQQRAKPPAKQALALPTVKAPKIVGGSTITQQLAKNLFLSGERSLPRKGQELVITLLLETFLSKQRILEIYLNNVEWGQGIFGAEAAAQYYYRKPASQLSGIEAARLAVMLPRPKYFETRLNSGYLASRANTIAARMSAVELP